MNYNGTNYAIQLMELVMQEEKDRLMRINLAQRAFDGLYTPPLKDLSDRTNDSVMPNLARLIVDKSAMFLFGKTPIFKIAGASKDKASAYLQGMLKANKIETWLTKLAFAGGVSGHAFVKLNPPKDSESYPRLILLDTSSVRAVWDDEDIDTVDKFVIEYDVTPDVFGEKIGRRQTIQRNTQGAWSVVDEKRLPSGMYVTISATDWQYSWAPVAHCQNLPAPNLFYGYADLEPNVLHLISRIHFVLSNTARINRIHAHPKAVAYGISKQNMQSGVDDILFIAGDVTNDKTRLELLESSGDIAGSLSLYERLHDALMQIARIPQITMAKMDSVGALSGVAMQVLYAPLIELTELKRRTYGEMLVELLEHALELGGHKGCDVEIEWRDAVPQNDREVREIMQMDLDMGLISTQTAAERIGVNYDTEKKIMDKSVEPYSSSMQTEQ